MARKRRKVRSFSFEDHGAVIWDRGAALLEIDWLRSRGEEPSRELVNYALGRRPTREETMELMAMLRSASAERDPRGPRF